MKVVLKAATSDEKKVVYLVERLVCWTVESSGVSKVELSVAKKVVPLVAKKVAWRVGTREQQRVEKTEH